MPDSQAITVFSKPTYLKFNYSPTFVYGHHGNSPINEARSYLTKARSTLSQNAKKEGKLYGDKKYIKTAGHQAYTGVLVALDAIIKKPRGGHSDEHYKRALAKLDKKALQLYIEAYILLHLAMGYEGSQSVALAQDGLKTADELICWVETKLTK